jgi:hypothetical protein
MLKQISQLSALIKHNIASILFALAHINRCTTIRVKTQIMIDAVRVKTIILMDVKKQLKDISYVIIIVFINTTQCLALSVVSSGSITAKVLVS